MATLRRGKHNDENLAICMFRECKEVMRLFLVVDGFAFSILGNSTPIFSVSMEGKKDSYCQTTSFPAVH